MREAERRLTELGIEVVVVTFELQRDARAYADETALPWPIVVDERRELYHAYSMGKAELWDVLGPAVWRAYFRELLRGQLPRWPHADTQQQGGDVLIDPNGIVRVHHVGAGPADRPQIQELVRARQRLD